MILTPRLVQLLKILLKTEEPMPVDRLAEEVQISKRTVFRELENVQKILDQYCLRLEKKTGKGLRIIGDPLNCEKFLKSLALEEPEIMDKKERQERLILEILKDKNPKKIFYFSNMFQVSESTISNDLEAIAPWFEKSGLKLVRKPGYGVALEGSEENYRRGMTKLIYKNIHHWKPEVFLSPQEKALDGFVLNQGSDTIYELLNKETIREVNRILESLMDLRLEKITESSYLGFVINLTLCIERIRKKEKLSMDQELLEEMTENPNYDLALKIGNTLEEAFQIHISKEELAYICIYFNGAKPKYVDREEIQEEKELVSLIYEMMDCYQISVAYELKLDEELIEGLLAHLLPTLTRLKYKIEIDNPLLESVKKDYPEIFENSKKAAQLITKTYGYLVPENEVGFLSLHFGAAMVRLENRKKNYRRVKIAVVCNSGIGISRLMGSRIENIFSEKAAVEVFGKEEILSGNLEPIDFIVSNFDIGPINKPVIIVSPILIESDLDKISQKIKAFSMITEEKISGEGELDFQEDFYRIQKTIEEMKSIMDNFLLMDLDHRASVEEVISFIGNRLGKTEDTKKEIIKDLLKRENIGTQVIPEFGFALFHTRTKGVESCSFSLALPDTGEFSHPDFKNIQAAIIMLIPQGENAKAQSKVMGSISTALIEDDEFLEDIKTGNTMKIQKKVYGILKKHLLKNIQKAF